jgi:hypothetical protein
MEGGRSMTNATLAHALECLQLEMHGDAVEWSRAAWLDLARQLATLHALPIPSGNHWPGELAFLWSRASADGADVPYDAMLDVCLSGADPRQMRRALVAAELGILLFGWPEHAAYSAPVVQDRLARRLVQLTDRWLSGTT